MINADIYTETLAAGASVHKLFSGAFFKIISATGPVTVRTSTVKLAGLVAGQGFEKAPFDYVELTDASGGTNTIKYVVATDGFLDGMTGNMAITSNVPPQSANFANAQGSVGVASALLVNANANRRYLLIQNNDSAATLRLRFGSAATAVTGIKIGPGQFYEMADVQSTQAIHALADIATTNVVIVEG